MKKMYYVALATLVAAFSCAKEAPIQKEEAPIQGHAVTLGVTMPGKDTKIDHSLVTDAIHPVWEAGDQIEVVYGSTSEIFTLSTGEGTQSATFTNGSSKLKEGTEYAVYYPSKDYDWSVQDGTLANLPNYLVKTGLNSLTASINLEPQLTYFYFDLTEGSAPGEDVTIGKAYLYNRVNAFELDSDGNTGIITITPTSDYSYTAGGTSTNAQFYVAFKPHSDTDGNPIRLDLGNYGGVKGFALQWDAAQNYVAGKAYSKKTSSSDLIYDNGLVGKEDNTAGFWDNVKDFDVPAGYRLQLQFTNFGNGAKTWNNWNVTLRSGLAWDVLLASLRSDKAARVGNWETWDNSSVFFTKNNSTIIDWTDYIAKMQGATVNATVDYSKNGYVYSSIISTSADASTTYKYNYAQKASGTEILHVTLNPDLSHAIVKSASIVPIPASDDVKSVSASAKAYYEGNADKIILSPSAIKVTKTFEDATTALAESSIENRIASNETVGIGGSNSAIVNFWGGNNLTCTGVAVSASQTHTLTTTSIGDKTVSWLDGSAESDRFTVAPGTSQTVAMDVASLGTEVWQGPVVRLFNKDDAYVCAPRVDGYILDAVADTRYSDNWGSVAKETILNGSTMVITVANDGNGYASVRYNIKGNNSVDYYQYYDYIAVPAGNISFDLKTDNCKLTWK